MTGEAQGRGRPSVYTEDIADEICTRLSLGETLNSICKDAHMPAKATVLDWALRDREGFSDRYARARNLLLDYWADDLIDISDNGSNDWMERAKKNGEVEVALNREHVSRSELRVNTRKWLLSKLKPERYGDQIKVDQTATFKTVTDKPLTREEEQARWMSQFGNVKSGE